VKAPVDCEFAQTGIRFRHLPGSICLTCRNIYLPNLTANPALTQSISNCLNLDPGSLIILKARTHEAYAGEEAGKDGFYPAFLDIGLGENGGLVVENVKGFWNWDSFEAILPNEGLELRERLLNMEMGGACRLVPSLLYDTPQHPSSIQIELTTRCNLTCAYCSNKDLEVQGDISLEQLSHLFDHIDFSKVENVDFTGLGEPMLYNKLPDIIKQLKLRGSPANIRVVTNGTVLTLPRIKELCDAGITSIAFSIDSVNEERFAKSRGNAKLKKVINNLEALVAYRNEHALKHLEIKIKAVLIDDPYNEADGLMKVSAKLGIEMPHFSCLDNRGIAQEKYKEPWMKDDWSTNGSPHFLFWTQKRWSELNGGLKSISLGQVSFAERSAGFINPIMHNDNLCRWAIDAVFISSSGDMLSCCEQMIDLPRQYRGSLTQKNLYQLWQDDLLWSYRLPLSVGVAPKECIGCNWAPATAM
jgi:molybdenum cofactor biosynthesis enzyme MoaA